MNDPEIPKTPSEAPAEPSRTLPNAPLGAAPNALVSHTNDSLGNDTHARVIELRRTGTSFAQIAAILGISKSTAFQHVQSEVKTVKRGLKTSSDGLTREEIHRKIFGFAPMAVEQIKAIASRTDAKPEVILKACADLLDRAGFNPIQKNSQVCEDCARLREMPREQLIAEIDAMLDRIEARQKAEEGGEMNEKPALEIQQP